MHKQYLASLLVVSCWLPACHPKSESNGNVSVAPKVSSKEPSVPISKVQVLSPIEMQLGSPPPEPWKSSQNEKCENDSPFFCLQQACEKAGGVFSEKSLTCVCGKGKLFFAQPTPHCLAMKSQTVKGAGYLMNAPEFPDLNGPTVNLFGLEPSELKRHQELLFVPVPNSHVFINLFGPETTDFSSFSLPTRTFPIGRIFPSSVRDGLLNASYFVGFSSEPKKIMEKWFGSPHQAQFRNEYMATMRLLVSGERIDWKYTVESRNCLTTCFVTAILSSGPGYKWHIERAYVMGRAAGTKLIAEDLSSHEFLPNVFFLNSNFELSHLVMVDENSWKIVNPAGKLVREFKNMSSQIDLKLLIPAFKTLESHDNPVIVVEFGQLRETAPADQLEHYKNIFKYARRTDESNDINLGWLDQSDGVPKSLSTGSREILTPNGRSLGSHAGTVMLFGQDAVSRLIVPVGVEILESEAIFERFLGRLPSKRTQVFNFSFFNIVQEQTLVENSFKYQLVKKYDKHLFVMCAGNSGLLFSETDSRMTPQGGRNLSNRIVVGGLSKSSPMSFAPTNFGADYVDTFDDSVLGTSLAAPKTAALSSSLLDFLPDESASNVKNMALLTAEVPLHVQVIPEQKLKTVQQEFLPARSGGFSSVTMAQTYARLVARGGHPTSRQQLINYLYEAKKDHYSQHQLSEKHVLALIEQHLSWLKDHRAISGDLANFL